MAGGGNPAKASIVLAQADSAQTGPVGVLVGVPLTDERLQFQHLDRTPRLNEAYWLALPENQAGPDLVGPRMLFSMKTTSKKRVTSAESQKSIKTTTPSKLYTKANGKEYTEKAWKKKRASTQKAIRKWKNPIVRVRVELPKSSKGTSPKQVLSVNGRWHCEKKKFDTKKPPQERRHALH